ncbi:MAG: hypothetical protein IKV99_04010 [Oscillospiraceae bacterium]|nr:hypothetical protein [Oscillospiraceae bacterium]
MSATLWAILIILVPAVIMFIRQIGVMDNVAPPSYLDNSDGTQIGRLNKWLNEHPEAKSIYNSREVCAGYREKMSNDEIGKNLLNMGAKVVFVSRRAGDPALLIITKEMMLAVSEYQGRKEVAIAPNKGAALERIRRQDIREYDGYTAPGKEKSVVKSAVVGGIIGGGAGAVVGAIAAENHNRTAATTTRTVVTSYKTGKKEAIFWFKTIADHITLDHCSWTDIYTAPGIRISEENAKESISQLLDKIW